MTDGKGKSPGLDSEEGKAGLDGEEGNAGLDGDEGKDYKELSGDFNQRERRFVY